MKMTFANSRRKWKTLLSLLLAIVLTFQLAMPAFAAGATVSVLDGLLTITDEEGTAVSAQDDVVTITVTGFTSGAWNNLITLTSNADYKAELKFDYTIVDASEYTGFDSNSGTYTATIEAGAEIELSFTAPAATTATLTMSNFSLTAVSDSANVTVEYDSNLGSVTVDNETVADGAVIEGVGTSGVTLTAVPNAGATFVGWVDESGTSLSTEATYTHNPTGDITLTAVFATAAEAPWFRVGSSTTQDLAAAITSAQTQKKTIVLVSSGTLPANTTYTIPSGVKLLIPYNDAYTENFNETPGTSTDKPGSSQKPYATLTLGEGTVIDCRGQICVNGQVEGTAGSYTGVPTGPYGHINLSSETSQIVLNGGKLYCYGYITGAGDVIANSGTVYEVFQLLGWKGGSAAAAWYQDGSVKSFPVNDYAMQNIEADFTVNSGATAKGVASITVGDDLRKQIAVEYIGENAGLVQLGSGASVCRSFSAVTNRMCYTLSGTAAIGSVNITIQFTGFEAIAAEMVLHTDKITMNSADQILAIPYYMDFVAAPGSTVTLSNDYKLLPGASITIDPATNSAKAAEVIVTGNLYIYDTADYVDQGYVSGNSIPVRYVASTGATAGSLPKMNSSTTSGQVTVNGTLTVNGGIFTTVNVGTSVDKVLKGTGTITNHSTRIVDNALDEYTYSSSEDSITRYQIKTTPAVGKLAGVSAENGYTSFSGNSTTYYGLGDGWWYQHKISLTGTENQVTVVPVGGSGIEVGSTATVIGYSVSGGEVSFQVFGMENGYAPMYNGEAVTCEGGVYTISNITGDMSLTLGQSGHTCEAVDNTVYTIEADCLHDGYSYQICTVGCAMNTSVIDALGHSEVTDAYVAPTCSSYGLTEGTHCDRCGEILVAQESIAKLPHTFVDEVCSVCNAMTGVTGPLHYWEFNGKAPVNVAGGCLTVNPATANTNKTAYSLGTAIQLKHENPWTITWVGNHTTKSHSVGFVSGDNAKADGARYLFIAKGDGGGIYLGQTNDDKFDNYGVYNSELTTYADGADHVYTLKNVPDALGAGENMIYLFVDGTEIGPMNQYSSGGTQSNTTSDALSGMDFNFTYWGTDDSTFALPSFKSVKVDEAGDLASHHEFVSEDSAATCLTDGCTGRVVCKYCGFVKSEGTEVPSYGGHKYLDGLCVRCEHVVPGLYQYKWNFTDGVPVSVSDDCLGTNAPTQVTEGQYYTLEKDIVLKADKPWQVSWTGSHVSADAYFMPLCSRAGIKNKGTTYIFGGQTYGIQVGRYTSSSDLVNYGFMTSALKAYAEGTHEYLLSNEKVDGVYRINLYIDGNLIGAMQDSKGNYANFDLTFGAMGSTSYYTPKDFKNLTVFDGTNAALALHDLQENKETATASTCKEHGIIGEMICSVCDLKVSDTVERPLADHNYVKDTCDVCGETRIDVGLAYKWTFENAVPTNVTTGGYTPVVTTPGGTTTNKVYSFDSEITLNHTDPWEIEWTAYHTVSSNFVPLISEGGYEVGATYMFITGKNGIYMGYASEVSGKKTANNYGVTLADLAKYAQKGDGIEHTYSLRNNPDGLGEGQSMVYLYIDNQLVGPMTNSGIGASADTDYTENDTKLSNRDFTFKQMGAGSPFVMSDSITSLTVVTGREREGIAYKWSFKDDGVMESVTDDCLAVNPATANTDKTAYSLKKAIQLKHENPWTITWVGNHTTKSHRVGFVSGDNAKADGARYLFIAKGDGGGIYLGQTNDDKFDNYGVYNSELTTYADGADHVYTLKNVPDALGAGENMIYLFVDGTEIGPMNQYSSGGTQSNTTSDALSGMDFSFTYWGATGFALPSFKSVAVCLGTEDSYFAHTWETKPGTPATCIDAGVSDEVKCSVCGYLQEAAFILPKKAHNYVDGRCTGCNEVEVGEGPFYKWDFTNEGVIENVTGGCLTANGTQKIADRQYTLEKDVVLRADKPWQVSWEGTHNTDYDFVLLCSREGMYKQGTTYIFGGKTNGIQVGCFTSDSSFVNYGFASAALKKYAEGNHKYLLSNEKVNGVYRINLYIDGELIGAMRDDDNNYANFDLTFGATGHSSTFYPPRSFTNVTVNEARSDEGYTHTPVDGVPVPATCTSTGLTADQHCDYCGIVTTESEATPEVPHTYGDDDICSGCGRHKKAIEYWNDKYVSIVGDSMSTYEGVSNDSARRADTGSNKVFYPKRTAPIALNDTYWMQTINDYNMRLCVNNSISGSGALAQTSSKPSYERADRLHTDAGQNPDVILLFLGMNDIGKSDKTGVGPGTVDYTALKPNGTYKDPENWAEAYAITVAKMKETYPDAVIFCLTPLPQNSHYSLEWAGPDALNKYCECLKEIAKHYKVPVVDLVEYSGITWDNIGSLVFDKIHLAAPGMTMLADCLMDTMEEYALEGCIHSYKPEVTDPTCTEAGYTTYTCDFCDDSYVDDEVEALGHSLTETRANAATCTAPGNSAYWTCGTCGKYFSDADGNEEIAEDSWILDKLEHSYIGEWEITADGHAQKCTNGCGEPNPEVEPHTDIEAENHMCDICGYEMGTCADSEQTTTYTRVEGTETHTVTVTCDVCGQQVGEVTTADCVDNDSNDVCDLCGGMIAEDPEGTTVSGTVKAYNSNNAPEVKLYVGGVEKYTAVVSEPTASGNQYTWTFTFSDVEEGSYDLVVTKAGHLSYTVTGVQVTDQPLDLNTHSNVAISIMSMLCGDIDEDGFINFADYQELLKTQNYGKQTTQNGVNVATDLDGDTWVNFADYQILLSSQNYGKSAVLVPYTK